MSIAPQPILVVSSLEKARKEVAAVLSQAGLKNVSAGRLIADADSADNAAGNAAGNAGPSLIVICGPEPALLCGDARELPSLARTPILALVPSIPQDAAAEAIAAGATEVLVGTLHPAVLGNRVRTLLAASRDRSMAFELSENTAALLRVQGLLADGGDAPETLRQVLLTAVQTVAYDRASLIAHVEGSQHGYVIAATDDPHLQRFTLLMSDYPELLAALETRVPLFVNDVDANEITRPLATTLREKGVRSLAVLPIFWRRRVLGAIFFRRSQPVLVTASERQVRFGKLLASQLAATLRHGDVLERLRDQTRRISRASYEAERRLRTIESLKEHFEASADGVVVLDGKGQMLFVNRTAEAITGFARDGLIGSALTDLVHPADREPLEEVIRSVLAGTNLEAFDLDLVTTGGGAICVSVTTSTVLSRSAAVILSFRDVTAQRALESELEQTKDFLEKLIDSAVDAIIASDMDGRVIIFNSGAERIHGYRADEVVGAMSVEALYPEGVANQVLRMLRSPDFGGVGQLEQTRREVLAKNGELIPVHMTASIIYDEDEQEVASVGIFTDLRERLRMEERLASAQRQLRVREKEAAIAELAGGAAHELNQPLTSILATASMLERGNAATDEATKRRIGVIVTEAERMAELVRKIGRIVRYETKEYVGGASILDLEASSDHRTIESLPPMFSISPKSSDAVPTSASSEALASPQGDDEVTDELPGPPGPEQEEITAEHRRKAGPPDSAKTIRMRPIDAERDCLSADLAHESPSEPVDESPSEPVDESPAEPPMSDSQEEG